MNIHAAEGACVQSIYVCAHFQRDKGGKNSERACARKLVRFSWDAVESESQGAATGPCLRHGRRL